MALLHLQVQKHERSASSTRKCCLELKPCKSCDFPIKGIRMLYFVLKIVLLVSKFDLFHMFVCKFIVDLILRLAENDLQDSTNYVSSAF